MVGPVLILIFYRASRASKRRKKSESEEELDEGSEEEFESDLEKMPPHTEDEEMSEGEPSGEDKEQELGRGARGRANVRVSVGAVVGGEWLTKDLLGCDLQARKKAKKGGRRAS